MKKSAIKDNTMESQVAMPAGLSDIFPVVVLYKCQCKDAMSWRTLIEAGGFAEFMVYDNSPRSFQADLSVLPIGVVYVRDEENGGLSKAYNHAAHYARSKGYGRLLLLDQDTTFAPEAIDAYMCADRSVALWVPRITVSGGRAFSPVDISSFRNKAVEISPGRYSLRDYLAVNSGMCVRLDDFFAAGGYNEAVRLDFSDFQFLRRLRKISSDFEVLWAEALQDFSNDKTDAQALLARYRLYMESASYCEYDTVGEHLCHFIDVTIHTFALFLKTWDLRFPYTWIKYLLRR